MKKSSISLEKKFVDSFYDYANFILGQIPIFEEIDENLNAIHAVAKSKLLLLLRIWQSWLMKFDEGANNETELLFDAIDDFDEALTRFIAELFKYPNFIRSGLQQQFDNYKKIKIQLISDIQTAIAVNDQTQSEITHSASQYYSVNFAEFVNFCARQFYNHSDSASLQADITLSSNFLTLCKLCCIFLPRTFETELLSGSPKLTEIGRTAFFPLFGSPIPKTSASTNNSVVAVDSDKQAAMRTRFREYHANEHDINAVKEAISRAVRSSK
jgi:hypothetical protein